MKSGLTAGRGETSGGEAARAGDLMKVMHLKKFLNSSSSPVLVHRQSDTVLPSGACHSRKLQHSDA